VVRVPDWPVVTVELFTLTLDPDDGFAEPLVKTVPPDPDDEVSVGTNWAPATNGKRKENAREDPIAKRDIEFMVVLL